MSRSSKRMVVLGIVLLLLTAACGDDAAADPERFCEIDAEFEELGDPFEAAPDESRAMFKSARSLLDESIRVAPDEIRSSVEIQVASFDPFFALFESVDFDPTQLDEAEIEGLFESFSDETEAAFTSVEDWVDANCTT